MPRFILLWRRAQASLQARILLPTAVLFALILTLMAWAALHLSMADMERGQRERAELFGGMVAGGLTTMMLENGNSQVSELLSVMASHRSDIDAINLLAPSGQVVSSSDETLIGARPWPDLRRFVNPELVSAPGGDATQYAWMQPIPNQPACAACHLSQSRINGVLEVRFSRRPALVARQRLARTLLLSGVPAFGALVVICWWLLGREALHPLQRMVRVMRRAANGQASLLADEGRPDELGQAARSFDAMMAALAKSRAENESLYRKQMVRAERFACIGELAANLAHEIKNPLAGLSGALELLAEDLKREPMRAEMVDEMRHQVARLTRTMESLLSFARSPKAQLRATDINSALERMLFIVEQQRRAAESRVLVDLELAPDLPPVLADPGQVEQVFLNLSLNACQAMNGHGGVLAIRSFRRGGDVTVQIADSGPGIPQDVRPHIFEPLFTTKPDGTGLGLALSARIISEHRGTIRFDCPPEGGTVFSVTLPVSPTIDAATAINATNDGACGPFVSGTVSK